jgi:hypothetical protein
MKKSVLNVQYWFQFQIRSRKEFFDKENAVWLADAFG